MEPGSDNIQTATRQADPELVETDRISGSDDGRNWRGLTLSIGLHLLLLTVLVISGFRASVGAGSMEVRRVDMVLTSIAEDNQVEYLTETDVAETEARNAEPAQASLPVQPPQTLQELEPVDDLATMEMPAFDAAGMTQLSGTGNTSARDNPLSESEQAMLDADRQRFAAQANQGSEVSLRVFGSGELTGRRFVFLLDRSKSMGSSGLGVLDIAADELSKAISVLEPHHQFQVIAYHHSTLPISERQLLKASSDNKSLVREFVSGMAAFGSTNHAGALIVALSFRPDIVVLMTDGDIPVLNESQLEQIRRTAGSAQIHCIQFGSGHRQSREGFMEELAAQNNGSYRYVDVRNMKQR